MDLRARAHTYTDCILDATARGVVDAFSHMRMPLTHFCKGVNDIDHVRCVLDCPLIEPYMPSFIK